MTELCEFQCHSHTVGTVGDKSIPNDHVPVRLVIECPRIRQSEYLVIRRWLTQHSLFACALHEAHRNMMWDDDPFVALHQFKEVVARACYKAWRAIWVNTPTTLGAKLLIVCTALRACRNQLDSTVQQCCSSWELAAMQCALNEALSSASQMPAAKVMMALQDCQTDGQAADAISACAQVKMEDPPILLRIHKSERPGIWILFHNTDGQNQCRTSTTQRFSQTKPVRTPICRTKVGKKVRKDSLGSGMGKGTESGNAHLFTENKVYSYRYTWRTGKWKERSRIRLSMRKKLMKRVDLDEPTSFIDHVYLGQT